MKGLSKILDAHIDELKGKLKEKREILEIKNALQLCINVSDSIQKIEKLLHLDSFLSEQKPLIQPTILLKDDEETSNLIERVASEFNQLQFYVSRGKGYSFVKQMNKVKIITSSK